MCCYSQNQISSQKDIDYHNYSTNQLMQQTLKDGHNMWPVYTSIQRREFCKDLHIGLYSICYFFSSKNDN